MLVPFVCPAEAVIKEPAIDNPEQLCMCGSKGPMRGKLCVWTHKSGTADYGWYVACDIGCYAANVTEGAC